jgi:hypothetical protein
MYENVVKDLRHCVESPDHRGCAEGCSAGKEHPLNYLCISALMTAAADAIEELQGRVKVLEKVADKWCEAVPKWIPVTERLPESIHEYVLCCGEKGGQFVGWVGEGRIVNGKACAFQHGGRGRYITHWMPLPQPPKEET